MEESQIPQVFTEEGLGAVRKVVKSKIGFSNDVYFVNDDYVLKVGRSLKDTEPLHKEIYLCDLFKDVVPAPEVVSYSLKSPLTGGRAYVIYKRIKGEELYSKWHVFSDKQRERIVEQIAGFLKEINKVPADGYIAKFDIDTNITWREIITKSIQIKTEELFRKGLIDKKMEELISQYMNRNSAVLDEQKMALTYFDAHFDNILVEGDKVVGMLDFERTDWLSIDFSLDLVNRMMNLPQKYVSEEIKAQVKEEDYLNLMSWYRKYYPEMFDFRDLDMRLNMYSLKTITQDFVNFPQYQFNRDALKELVGYDS